MSVYITGRAPSDPAGTMETPVLVPAGTGQGNNFDGRAGDLSGINIDPSDGTFWAANEYTDALSKWGTAIVNFTINGNATHFSVSAPSSATAGSAFNFTVTALDPSNNTAIGYTGTVHLTSSDGQSVLPANTTLTNGTGTFSATLKTAGNQTITATDNVTGAITGTSSVITVNASSATHFTVSVPASAVAGTVFNITVTALDQFGNTATGYGGTVHFTSSDPQAALPADSTLTNGTRTFSASLKTAGSQTITTSDSVTSSITGTSGTITVSASSATHFNVSAPATATAGT